MGFYTKYFSILMKGVTATSWKERIEARRLIYFLKKQDNDLYKKIRKKVSEHRVTSALEDLNHFIKEVAKAAENAEKLIFNAITSDQQIIKAEKEILDALAELSNKTKGNKSLTILERELAISIYDGCKLAEGQEREEYKLIMQILDEAELEHKDFMEAMRLRFQKETAQTLLAKWIIRGEITRERRDIRALQKIAQNIKKLTARIHSDKASAKDEGYIKKHLEEDYIKTRDALKDAFYESYLIKKRDLIMVLKILFNLNTLREWLVNWAHKHDLPLSSVMGLINQIKDLEHKIAKEFRPIAQGFRIIINSIDGIQNQAFAEGKQLR